ncbi:MAG: alpha/beta fold hydrolase [Geminicoccaceae bacterium]
MTEAARRRGPRPLALHVACAEWAWRTRHARQLNEFYRGIKAYRQHPYRRKFNQRPTVWQAGGCSLLDYGPKDGWPILVVPSMINRAYILDLMPGASLLDHLRDNGFRSFLLDWGGGMLLERRLHLDKLILERMAPALDRVRRLSGKPPIVLGYCMGGTMATALACLFEGGIAGLALLAAPWNFRREDCLGDSDLPGNHAFASCIGSIGSAPIDILQAHFARIDPMNVPSKFARFASMTPESKAALRFVAIEDWLNDGVPLGAEVAAECFMDWYGNNAPARGVWKVDGYAIRPDKLNLPVCLAIPERDQIVPPDSALALADIIPGCHHIRPRAGHVGMVAGRHAEATLWNPLTQWLERIAAMQKNPW